MKNNKNIKLIICIAFLISYYTINASQYDIFLNNDKKVNILYYYLKFI